MQTGAGAQRLGGNVGLRILLGRLLCNGPDIFRQSLQSARIQRMAMQGLCKNLGRSINGGAIRFSLFI